MEHVCYVLIVQTTAEFIPLVSSADIEAGPSAGPSARPSATDSVAVETAPIVSEPAVAARPKVTKKSTSSAVTHSNFASMAKQKCTQIDEQLNMMKVREEREKELHSLQVEKIELERTMMQDREKREIESHALDMKIKDAKLKILLKQLQEE